jgi:hypothetical protein
MKALILFLAFSAAESGDYQKAIPLLNFCEQNSLVNRENHHRFYFYKTVSEFQTLKKEEAQESCKKFYESFDKPPTRYEVLVYQMDYELKKWGEDPLADIARKMGEVSRRLETAYGGKETQEKQKKIVEDLDKLIQETMMKGMKANGEDETGKNAKAKKNGSNNQSPAPDSIIMGGKGEGKVDEKRLREIAKSWGTLPPAKRAEIVREVVRDLPAKYEGMIRNYFEALDKLQK